MIEIAAPEPLIGDLLRQQLVDVNLLTDVVLAGSVVRMSALGEADRADAQAALDAHPATAQAALDAAQAERANEVSIRDKATTTLDANKTFLALNSPTNAQVVAQVKALTRQNNALIRLVLRRFDATD